MSNEQSVSVKFQPKFMAGWLVISVILYLFLLFSVDLKEQGINIFEMLFLSVGFVFGYTGFVYLFLDAGLRHGFRFNEIMYPSYLWYIYPIICFFYNLIFPFQLFLGMAISTFKSDKS